MSWHRRRARQWSAETARRSCCGPGSPIREALSWPDLVVGEPEQRTGVLDRHGVVEVEPVHSALVYAARREWMAHPGDGSGPVGDRIVDRDVLGRENQVVGQFGGGRQDPNEEQGLVPLELLDRFGSAQRAVASV